MPAGTIKWFNESKGFGMITADDGQEVYLDGAVVRRAGCRALQPGQRVEFDLLPKTRRPQARRVMLLQKR